MTRLRKALLVVFLFLPVMIYAQPNKSKLEAEIKNLITSIDGKVGIGISGLDFNETLLINDGHHYPMQSVFKFPLAIYILHLVDNKKLSLDQQVKINRKELMPNTWSPMLRDFKDEHYHMRVSELLQYSVSKSDNNACDILFQLADGTKKVDRFFKNAKVSKMSIAATELEMSKDWNVQYTNWCQPSGMLQTLQLFYAGKLLKPASNALLMKLMVESENSAKRLKGMIPENAVVAHKTGTGGDSPEGIKSATNDVGIITLPNGKHYAIVVFVSDYKGGLDTGEKTIAAISKLVWEYYSLSSQ